MDTTAAPETGDLEGRDTTAGTASASNDSPGALDTEVCCEPTVAAGCIDPVIEACVCDFDPSCCERAWDAACVREINRRDCGRCDLPEGAGPCCDAGLGPGCAEPNIEACVCAIDPRCCHDGWDDVCADLVVNAGCGTCLSALNPRPSCCEAHVGPGCSDAAIEDCVCSVDPYCCEETWDQGCTSAVSALGCSTCPPAPPPPASCCEPSLVPGCAEADVAACVCRSDPYCCAVAWDEPCIDSITTLSCGTCP